MALPQFNELGDLPPGVHRAPLGEVLHRFGGETTGRRACTRRLAHVVQLARRTGHLQSVIIFGSYVTTKPEPNDVDLVLIMRDSFQLEECPVDACGLFDHSVAQARYGASIFWIRPALLIAEALEDFVAYWQIKRDGEKRGIVEVLL